MTATAELVPARAPRAQVGRAVLHLVPVTFSDVPAVAPALCKQRPRRHPWVLRPSWPTRLCPLCAERSTISVPADATVTIASGAITMELS